MNTPKNHRMNVSFLARWQQIGLVIVALILVTIAGGLYSESYQAARASTSIHNSLPTKSTTSTMRNSVEKQTNSIAANNSTLNAGDTFLDGNLEIKKISFNCTKNSVGDGVFTSTANGHFCIGFAIHKPLTKVPENTMKFIVGVLLTSFGIFWGVEGAGANWPHSDLSLVAIIPTIVIICWALIEFLKARKAQGKPVRKLNLPSFSEPSKDSSRIVRIVGGFLFFWYDFIIGDDWRVAAGVVLGFFITHDVGIHSWWIMPLVVALMLVYTLHEATRPAKVSVSN